jgi:MarR family transcriptional regulator, organic hydroperoxide resistance regulator
VSELRRDNLGWLLAKASQRWNHELEAAFRAAGFPSVRPAYGSVLVPLYEEDGLSMSELARRSGVSKQAMTTLVRAVEAAGFVTRERDEADGRAFRVSLSARGHELRPVAESVLASLAEQMRTRLRDAELEDLVSSLRKVVET